MAKSTPPDQVTLAGATVPQLGPYVFVPVGAATGFNRVRKNVPTAVRAFRLVSTPELKMVIAGTAMLTDAVLAELLPETEKGRLHQGCWISDDSRIRIVPTLPRREFLAAMALARGVVYPSRYEGFGLPLLEAMALGVPLIASRATSVPEIVQDAAWLVPPDDVEGFTHAMQTLVANPGQTETLVATGLQRMADFTWERMGTAMTRLFLQQIEVPPVRTIG
jgi:alpha-1,3-rhamnosyl/mannosyltransferase